MKGLLDYRIINKQIGGFSFQQAEDYKLQKVITQTQRTIEILKIL